jgi:cytochrome c-type biogenesis protein CcmH/NrfF
MKDIDLSTKEQSLFLDTAKELRCPTCTGLSILDSEATFSVQIQNIVKEKVKEGQSKDQIIDFFRDRYGPWIMREPPKDGLSLLTWALPIALLMSIFLGLFWNLSRTAKPLQTGVTDSFDAQAAKLEFVNKTSQLKASKRGT